MEKKIMITRNKKIMKDKISLVKANILNVVQPPMIKSVRRLKRPKL